ncbi:MAG TPA: metal-dependent hydrolase [Thermoanaerobaculia bacterium]|nr:metal-dependent hydrolase [Thermoanaerobaculia bacterium]
MFVGHNAVGFASKKVAPHASLGWLMAAPMLLDLLWPVFLLLGVERVRVDPKATEFSPMDFESYPWTHSLAMAIVWGVLFAGIYYLKSRYKAGAVTIFFGVVSHWVFDFFTHRPDLPLWPGGGPKVGLGLWNYPHATLIVELALFTIGFLIYRDVTEPIDRTGSVAMWLLALTLLGIYVATAGAKPPADPKKIAYGALTLIIVPFWAAWIDRHRAVRV